MNSNVENNPISIAFIINDLLLGGAQMAVLAIASGLNRTTFTPAVYYLNEYESDRPNLKKTYTEANLPLNYIGKGGKTTVLQAAWRLARALRESQPKIIHVHLVDATIAGLLASFVVPTARVIVHEHQTHTQYSWKVRFAYVFLRMRSSLTICYSSGLEEELFGAVHTLQQPPEHISFRSCSIYNGIDVERVRRTKLLTDRKQKRAELNIPTDAILITSIARLIGWKGQMQLVRAFAAARSEMPEAHLALVGEGPQREPLIAAARAEGVGEYVHLLGARTDAYEILAVSDISSLAFTYDEEVGEAVGIAGYEAMGFGLPVIVSAYPSAALSVSDGQNAILVRPNDSGALTDALIALANGPALRSRIGTAAAARIEKGMNWQTILPVYERIYKLLLTP